MSVSDISDKNLVTRLKRIEGQVRGLQRMIEEGRDCEEIVTQLSAVRNALDRVGFMILSHKMMECLSKKPASENNLDDVMNLFLKLS